jgi:hypothetical protein
LLGVKNSRAADEALISLAGRGTVTENVLLRIYIYCLDEGEHEALQCIHKAPERR